ncbi:hypothetical protein FHS83_003063 [Rhizomicrobium palustre]|uniref:DUF481 domain-containing protein n=1 Tax=Rhizomicrobium palustre TaxID=189966 RepID=A0A846N2N1_9PROT|nr:hypothetical protein [Rhizomicrobium palustre]NIK89745.1 hypothetical protein [Rhizomicrobium palustre]
MLLAFWLVISPTTAGAWTLPQGTLKTFNGVTSSSASKRYDTHGVLQGPAVFNKILIQNWIEYGVTDAFTLVVAPQYVIAETGTVDGGRVNVSSFSMEAGGRLLLTQRLGMLSLQASAKSAGAFDMSISASGEGGRQYELRLLNGHGFKLAGHDAFFDIEFARRWIKRPRPDEYVLDMTLGLWVMRNDLIMLQGFSVFSGEGVRRPYEPYRQSKFEISLVHRFSRRLSLQSGYFTTPLGRNTVRETGFVATIWFQV